MPNWRDCKLGDLLDVKHGFAFLGEHFSSAGTHVVLTPGNFKEEGGFKEKSDKPKWYNGPVSSDYVLNEGDLIVAMTEQSEGLLGSSALIPRGGVYLHNQRLGLVQIRDPKRADKHFIYYLFNWAPVRQQIRASASGVKIRHTAPSRIAEVKVSVPSLPQQQRIAATLSSYDDLIENSQQRIRIMERMARALYREWFVHFRFAGSEAHTSAEQDFDRLPEGWQRRALKEVCNLIMGQSPRSEFYNNRGEGMPFHQGVTDFGARFPKDRLFCTASGRDAEEGDILFSVRAPVGRLNIASKRIMLGRGLCAIRHRAGHQAFLWEQLRELFQEENTMGNGAIFPAVTKADMEGIALLCPPDHVVRRATEFLAPIHGEITTLTQAVENLQRTRDLLLPGLLSGRLAPRL